MRFDPAARRGSSSYGISGVAFSNDGRQVLSNHMGKGHGGPLPS